MIGKAEASAAARGIFDLIEDELREVEKAISEEFVAPVEAITTIAQYLQASGGKRAM